MGYEWGPPSRDGISGAVADGAATTLPQGGRTRIHCGPLPQARVVGASLRATKLRSQLPRTICDIDHGLEHSQTRHVGRDCGIRSLGLRHPLNTPYRGRNSGQCDLMLEPGSLPFSLSPGIACQSHWACQWPAHVKHQSLFYVLNHMNELDELFY